MRRKCQRVLFWLITLLIFLIIFSLVAVPPTIAIERISEVWKRDIGDNIQSIAVSDGKVFILTFHGDLYSLNQNNGQTLWNYSLGGYAEYGWDSLLRVVNGRVLVGSSGSKLTTLDENTGELLWEFQPSYFTTSFAMKAPPTFTVADGKVFTTGDGFYAVNATDGKLIWESIDPNRFRGSWVVANNRVLMESIGDPPTYDRYLNSLNADDGKLLWTYKLFTSLESSPVVADGRVLVWNRRQNQTMLCLNETSGSLLWKCDVGAEAFQPTVANGLVLFGASDGNFYALNESDGKLKWKYPTGYQSSLGYLGFAVARTTFDQVFVGYTVSSQGPQNEIEYQGYVSSINLVSGQLNWSTPISNNAASFSSFVAISLTFVNRTVYVTAFSDLYSIDVDSGKVQWVQNFDYWVIPPIYAYDKLFVAADLKVIAYGEAEPSNQTLWNMLIAIGVIAAVVIVITVYWLSRKHAKSLI